MAYLANIASSEILGEYIYIYIQVYIIYRYAQCPYLRLNPTGFSRFKQFKDVLNRFWAYGNCLVWFFGLFPNFGIWGISLEIQGNFANTLVNQTKLGSNLPYEFREDRNGIFDQYCLIPRIQGVSLDIWGNSAISRLNQTGPGVLFP